MTPKTTNLIAIPKNARMGRFAYQQEMEFVKFNSQAKQPTRVTEESAGYDLYSYQRVEIPPGEIRNINSGIGFGFEPPKNVFGLIKDRSSMAIKQHLCLRAGVTDQDFNGDCIIC